MNAIGPIYGITGDVRAKRAEPELSAPDEVRISILRAGACGLAAPAVSAAAAGVPVAVFGIVVETGSAVMSVKPGDYAVFTLRRGCGLCKPCKDDRVDMCYTGKYRNKAHHEWDLAQDTTVVDRECYLVRVPEELAAYGELVGPLAVAVKAIGEAIRTQEQRIPGVEKLGDWMEGRKALVTSLNHIGLMAALILRLKGALVTGWGRSNEESVAARILNAVGAAYRKVPGWSMQEEVECHGYTDLIFDTSSPEGAGFKPSEVLGINGIYIISGTTENEEQAFPVEKDMMKRIVMNNQMVLGSIDAGIEHYRLAVKELARICEQWPVLPDRIFKG